MYFISELDAIIEVQEDFDAAGDKVLKILWLLFLTFKCFVAFGFRPTCIVLFGFPSPYFLTLSQLKYFENCIKMNFIYYFVISDC